VIYLFTPGKQLTLPDFYISLHTGHGQNLAGGGGSGERARCSPSLQPFSLWASVSELEGERHCEEGRRKRGLGFGGLGIVASRGTGWGSSSSHRRRHHGRSRSGAGRPPVAAAAEEAACGEARPSSHRTWHHRPVMPAHPSWQWRRTCWHGGACSLASRRCRSSVLGKPRRRPRWPRLAAGISPLLCRSLLNSVLDLCFSQPVDTSISV
jgi:hypothetical protein